MTKKFHRAALVGVVLTAWLGWGAALAQGPQGERPGLGVRPIVLPPDRPGGDMSSFMADSPRRQDIDEARNPRRLSVEERRQLRRDVQDAGRDVYGNPPRRAD
ncbi:hypothetical protein [uncultured Zoogloea sp.]|uniref:hypothetical protein n=1 Tax=uncultured Zoogloea sp. TaxID=160237 RepID=UPI0026053049|nr:hypothetical protein [uncultured Zoogloea sp.]